MPPSMPVLLDPRPLVLFIASYLGVAISMAGRTIEVDDLEAVTQAGSDDWKVTALAKEEEAASAYQKGNWKVAAARFAQGQIGHAFAFRGKVLDGGLKHFLLRETELSREFLTLLKPEDEHEQVYQILQTLFGHDAERFRAYPRLAMAIALVYDQAPPQSWPHRQASSTALERALPDPVKAFAFWAHGDQQRETLLPLEDLLIEELLYVVDVAAPLSELAWARENLKPKLPGLTKLYWNISYDYERYEQRQTRWPDDDYRLPTILERGGICVDQAYYMTQVAKAHGVPCLSVTGVMEDGRHAWVSYLEAFGEWNEEAGRTPESFFVAGRAYNPQTWGRPMDYELGFLKERLMDQSRYRLSRLHGGFAEMARRQGDLEGAKKAAVTAVETDNRNLDAWELLIELTEETGEEVELLERLWANAAKAFRKYPDLEAQFLRQLARSQEARGAADDARRTRLEIVSRNRRERPDLALAEASRELHVAMEEASLDEQVSLYKRYVTRFRQAGLITGHHMVEPFVRHLTRRREFDLARKAIAYARTRLEVRVPEQLDRMLASLERRLPAS